MPEIQNVRCAVVLVVTRASCLAVAFLRGSQSASGNDVQDRRWVTAPVGRFVGVDIGSSVGWDGSVGAGGRLRGEDSCAVH